jgi:outer membrane murein-binding lipoprotein Lpp
LAGATHTDRIRELERESSTLVSQLASLKVDFDRAEEKLEATNRLVQDLDKGLALITVKAERLEEKLKEISTRRWEILKIVISAIVGAVLAVSGFFAKSAIDRQTSLDPVGRPSGSSDRK